MVGRGLSAGGGARGRAGAGACRGQGGEGFQMRGTHGGEADAPRAYTPRTAHMNTWRQVSYAAIPLTTAFGVYTMAGAEHGHEDVGEKPKYSYMRLRNKAYPWGKCGLFEINGCPESEE